MTIIILSVVIAILITIGVLLIKHSRTLVNDLTDDLQDEKDRSELYVREMAITKDLQKKANNIDQKIEVKKNERKKMSKAQKIAAASNRHSDQFMSYPIGDYNRLQIAGITTYQKLPFLDLV